MVGFAATLDHVRPGVSQIENASGTRTVVCVGVAIKA